METTCVSGTMDYNELLPNYGNLPMEIIFKIFRFLNHSDLQAAGATCCRWREAVFVDEFNRHTSVHFVKVNLLDRAAPAKFFLKSQRPYRSFCLEDVTFGHAQDFFAHIGKTAKEITLNNADMGEKQFYAFIKHMAHLESLTITCCSPLFMSGSFLEGTDIGGAFSNIKHLSLKHNQYLSDSILLRLTSLIKRIESLDISKCHIAYHTAILRRFYPNDTLPVEPNESILTFKFLAKITNLHKNYLKDMNLSHTMITGVSLQALASQEIGGGALSLQKLWLTGCRQLNTSGIQSFLLTQSNLVLLDLEYTLCVNDDCIATIVDSLPQLENLNVASCAAITNAGAVLLGNIKKLNTLNISRCDGISTDGLTQGIARLPNNMLKCLQMSHLMVCEEGIKCIARHCQQLRTLNVGHCVNGVTDTSVQCIIEHLRWLRELSLEGCFRITDAALTGINISKLELKKCISPPTRLLENFHPSTPTSLRELENSPQSIKISLRTKAEEEIRKQALFAAYELNKIDVDMIDGVSIQQMKGLRSINLNECSKITDVTLKYGLKFVELQRLCISNCHYITSSGLEALVLNCPSIEEIDLSDCYNINDRVIELLTKKLGRLRALHISGCTQLTEQSLDTILVNCKFLHTLSIYRCRRMYSDIEDRLAAVSTLRRLNMDNAASLDNMEFFRIKQRLDY